MELLADAEAGKNFIQNFIVNFFPGDFIEIIQSLAQIERG